MYSHIFQNDLLLSLPESFLCVSSLTLLLYGVLFVHQGRSAHILLYNVSMITVYVLLLTLGMVCNAPVQDGIYFLHSFTNDDLGFYLKILVLLSSIASILISIQFFDQEGINAFEYAIFVLFATLSVMLLIASYDLLSVYLTVEIQSLALYSLAATRRDSEFCTEAGLKYFMLGALSSGILLFGISVLYGSTGLTHLGELSLLFSASEYDTHTSVHNTASLGMACIGIALLFKISAAPVHIWAPDVYEGAPTSVTSLLSIVPKLGVTAIILRIVCTQNEATSITSLLMFSGVLSIFIGGVSALAQRRIKRLLAFSSIGHIGYLLIGIACASLEGYQACLLYLWIYVIINLASFTCILSCASHKHRLRYIADLGGLAQSNPVLAVSLSITLFSLAGIPPFAGFFSKLYVFFAAMSAYAYMVCVLAVCATCIAAFYYLRMVRTIFFGHHYHAFNTSKGIPEVRNARTLGPPTEIDGYKSAILGMCVFFLMFFFIYPSPLISITYKVALSLS